MRAKFLSSILVVIALAAITACGGSSKSIPPVIAVSVSPTTAQVAGSATEQFTATVTNTTNTAVTWSVTGGGSINVAGLYTAPASVPTQAAVTVTATSQADSTKTATAAITLEADSVSVGPTTAQIGGGGTQQFTATVNNANPAVTWSVTGGGSIGASGLYTAPAAVPTQATITVKAVLKADAAATGSAKATLLADSVMVSPSPVQLGATGTQQFSTTLTNTNAAVTWSLTGAGSISSVGFYTAPSAIPTQTNVTVTATSQADSAAKGTAVITLLADSVTVSPSTAQLPAGGTQQFTATVGNNPNTAVTWSATGGGSISATGLYTVPNAVPTQTNATVTATLQADSATQGTSAVTLLPDSVAVTPGTANVIPSGTQQFTATVTNSVQTAVTWSVTGGGSIGATGLYTAPSSVTAPTQAEVTATLASDTTQKSTATASLLPLTGLSISPAGPTLIVGGTETFAATGTFTNGTATSTADWTAQSAWTSSNTATATITGGSTANAVAVGAATITATYGSVTGTTALNVTSQTMTAASLSGTYVFSITHAGTRGQAFSAGVFVADGTGLIIGGVEDFNAPPPSGTASNVSILQGAGCDAATPTTDSCYTVNADGRGSLHLTSASEGRGTDIYSFILSSDGSHGHLILSDSSGVEVGTFEKQTATTLGDGSYSLLLGGMDGTAISGTAQGPEALAGEFTISSGTISSATFDVNDNGAIDGAAACGATCPPPSAALTFSANYVQAGSNGRGTFVITPAGIAATQLVSGSWHFDFFVVSANKIVLIQTDPQGSATPTVAALTGTAEKQTFSGTPNLAGSNYVFLVERSAAEGLFGSAGQWEFQASPPNTLTGEMDANCLQSAPTCMATTTLTTITSSPYTVDATGRGTVAISTPRSYVFYAIGDPSSGTARMYVLETDNKTNAGVGMQQAASLSLPTGAMAFNMAQLATDGYDSSFSGQLTISGTDLSGIVDSNVAVNYVQTSSSNQASGTSLAGPDGNGRGTVTLNILNLPSPGLSTSYAFYLVSPSQMVIFGTSSNVVGHQNQDGTMEVQ